jgi:hypothetical protein
MSSCPEPTWSGAFPGANHRGRRSKLIATVLSANAVLASGDPSFDSLMLHKMHMHIDCLRYGACTDICSTSSERRDRLVRKMCCRRSFFGCTTTYIVKQVDHSAVRLLAMASPQQPARADAVFLNAAAKQKAIQANPLKKLQENNE